MDALLERGVALGIDWSGAAAGGKKIWAASVEFSGGEGRLLSLERPLFAARSQSQISEEVRRWLAAATFDVAGFDFCFGLQCDHVQLLGLPVSGPAELGRALRSRFPTADAFKLAVGPERKRRTDLAAGSPFAPTNLRMYRQTYWGLRALADVPLPVAPWEIGNRTIVEIVPAHVARKLPSLKRYKDRDGRDARAAAVSDICVRFGVSMSDSDAARIVSDDEGDALDAVLAALAAAAALESGYVCADADAARTGEGWIYSVGL